MEDFRERIKYYEKSYKDISDESQSFVKLYDVGKKVVVNNVSNYLQSKIVFYLMNLHVKNRTILLTRFFFFFIFIFIFFILFFNFFFYFLFSFLFFIFYFLFFIFFLVAFLLIFFSNKKDMVKVSTMHWEK